MDGGQRKKSDDEQESENDDDGLQGNYCIETFTYYRPAADNDDVVHGQHEYAPLHIKVESATSTIGGNIVSNKHDATGIMIWPATHLLCQHLAGTSRSSGEDNGGHSARHGQLGGADTVLELGCGVGLVGITAMKQQAHSPLLWVSTDMDQRALDLCRRNFVLNGIEVNDEHADSKVWTRTLAWGGQDRADELLRELRGRVNESERFFDAVVGADIVYPSTCGKVLDCLFSTVDSLLAPGGTFWLSFATRDGPVTPSRLLEAASEAGFMVESLPPLNASVTKLLPPTLDSKILVMTRSTNAKQRNNQLGSVDCTVFPRLREMLARLDESSSEEEWEGPPMDSDDL
jgi:SAM-dependent methyltransferase